MKLCAVYALGMPDGRLYIGGSSDVQKRFSAHKCAIEKHNHSNRNIRKLSMRSSGDSFSFSILERCDRDALLIKEQAHIDAWRATGLLVNLAPSAGSNRGIQYLPFSDEHRKKIGQSHRGMRATSEAKQKMSQAKIGRKQGPMSEEQKMLIAIKKHKKIRCIDTGEVFLSVAFAAKELRVCRSAVSMNLTGRNKTAAGLKFEYAHDI